MKKKLLYIGNKPSGHKSNPTAHNSLVKGLRADGFIIYSASRLNNKVLRLGHMISSFFGKFRNYNLILIDVYSTQNFWYAVVISRLAKIFSKKYIPILHGGDLKSRFSRSPEATKTLFQHAAAIVSPSKYLKEEVERLGFKNVHFLPNPVFIKNYPFKKREDLQPKLLWVRAFDEIYNPLLALRSLKLLLKEYPSAELIMVGPDKDGSLSNCRKFVKKHKLPVKFPGKLKKSVWISLAEEYDIFLNTTTIDNSPISVIEAMALGLPVVSTNVGGMPYLIQSGSTGILVPPNDPEEMANAVGELLRNPEHAASMGLASRRMAEGFDWEAIKHEWNEILS